MLLDGQPDRADPVLAHAAEVASHDPARRQHRPLRAGGGGGRAPRRWDAAAALVDQALGMVQAGRLDDYPHSAFVHALAARTALHRGDGPAAREHLARVARLRPLLTYGLSFLAVQTLLEAARAYLALDDAAGAKDGAAAGPRHPPPATRPRPPAAQAAELEAVLEQAGGTGGGVSSLTTAELRLLPLMSAHLSFREIGERLFVSRHTIKTQAISVYRKLGVSSRSEAIERARALGLLWAGQPRPSCGIETNAAHQIAFGAWWPGPEGMARDGQDPDPRWPASFELVESKLHRPRTSRGMVPRTALLERLLATLARLVCVVARVRQDDPAGPVGRARRQGRLGVGPTGATTTRRCC